MSVLDAGPAAPTPAADDVRAVAEEVWASYLGADLPLLDVGPGAATVGDDVVTGSVGVSGTVRATTTVQLPRLAAHRVAAVMLGLPPGTTPDAADVVDAVGELVNMVGGGVKSLLPEPSSLALPVVTAGAVLGDDRTDRAGRAVDLHCLWGAHPVRITVHVEPTTGRPS